MDVSTSLKNLKVVISESVNLAFTKVQCHIVLKLVCGNSEKISTCKDRFPDLSISPNISIIQPTFHLNQLGKILT